VRAFFGAHEVAAPLCEVDRRYRLVDLQARIDLSLKHLLTGHPARELRCDEWAGGCPYEQVGVTHINSSVSQAGDQPDLPSNCGMSARPEDQCPACHVVLS
jgi:hypothetical protein